MQKFNYQKSSKAAGKIYIGLDHGYGNIKTAHRVFQTGIECYDEEPIVSTNYVKYRDIYYVIGESHLVYQGNKTESDDFYILTLAGLAEEMKHRGLHEADVVLAVGLPLAWVKTQAAEWRNYLMREKELDFSFRKERYKVHLCGLEIFPQGLAAVHNCVMHLDEATPHLHIDYIPVANGYKTGMKTRNSLTKALQQMGFAKAVSKKENETVAWQQRERAYLTELCQEKGIDVEVLGVQRDNLTLPEYKAAMQKVEKLEHQAVKIEENNQRLAEQAEKLADQIAKLDEKEKDNKEVLKKHDLRADTLKTIAKETEKDTKKLKSAAVPVSNIFGGEEYVKVKKSDWDKIIDAFSRAVSRNKLLEKYEKKIVALEKKVSDVSGLLDKMKQFISNRGLGEAFAEFVKSLEPKTMKERLTEKQKVVKKQTQQKSMHTQEHGTSRKHNISTEL